MKKIKSLALAALFMSATAVAVTSCGGGEAEEIKQDSGLGVVKFLVSKLDGDIKVDVSKKEDIAKVLEMKAEDEYMSGKKNLKIKVITFLKAFLYTKELFNQSATILFMTMTKKKLQKRC